LVGGARTGAVRSEWGVIYAAVCSRQRVVPTKGLAQARACHDGSHGVRLPAVARQGGSSPAADLAPGRWHGRPMGGFERPRSEPGIPPESRSRWVESYSRGLEICELIWGSDCVGVLMTERAGGPCASLNWMLFGA
jgi:hypothetical protein